MTIIHAYRRTRPHTVDLFGRLYKFAANDTGHQVCKVDEPKAAARLLEIKEAYRAHESEPVDEPKDDDDGDEFSPFVLTGEDGNELDLRTLSDDELREFAKENEIAIHHAAKGDTIRTKIVEALNNVG